MNTIETFQAIRSSPPEKSKQTPADQPKVQSGVQSEQVRSEQVRSSEKAQTKPQEPMDLPQIEQTAQAIQEFLDANGRELSFEVHKDTGDVVIKVYRKADGTLIRQIPPSELRNMAQRMKEATGLLLEESA